MWKAIETERRYDLRPLMAIFLKVLYPLAEISTIRTTIIGCST